MQSIKTLERNKFGRWFVVRLPRPSPKRSTSRGRDEKVSPTGRFLPDEEPEMLTRWGLALGVSVILLPALVTAGDWPQFRGPNGSAVSAEKQLPAEWGAG